MTLRLTVLQTKQVAVCFFYSNLSIRKVMISSIKAFILRYLRNMGRCLGVMRGLVCDHELNASECSLCPFLCIKFNCF